MKSNFYKRLNAVIVVLIILSLIIPIELIGHNCTNENNQLNILFVGNSYVYVNNLPSILENIANYSDSSSLIADMVVIPGGTLQMHWTSGQALTKIKNQSWDYVILQEQSTLGYRLINGKIDINHPEYFYKYVQLFDTEIKKNNSKTVLLLTWARKYAPEHQKKLNYAYMNIAKKLNAKVLPVGIAWQKVRNKYKDIELYYDDGSHPSPKGSYLAACVIYSELFHESPLGLINHVQVYPTTGKGVIITDTTKTLINLSSNEAENLQKIAWETHKELADSGGYILLKGLSKQPPNEIIIKENDFANHLVGFWSGPLMLFDSPTVMTIKFSFENDILKFLCDFIYTKKSDTVSVQIVDSNIRDGHFSFSVKEPNDEGVSTFDGVLLDNMLIGIADYQIKNKSVHCSGFWKLVKSNNSK